tara:strand:+ start:980 stop:1168 length:189 start_codon:yes stop_codon:yes gene_type:complete
MSRGSDKKTISWNQMYDTVSAVIQSANEQMARQEKKIVIDMIVNMIANYNITLEELGKATKQ